MFSESGISELSRSGFLSGCFKFFALGSLSFQGLNCGPELKSPPLKGLSPREYHNLNLVCSYFLKGTQFEKFDFGLTWDNLLYGRKDSITHAELFHEVAEVPSSILASLILDFSLTPLIKLSPEKLDERLQKWRFSGHELKGPAYKSFKNMAFIALSSSEEYTNYVGYTKDLHLKPYKQS